jgi:spore germination protein KB
MYLFVVSSWIINECAIFINSTIMHNTPLYVFEGLLYLIVVLVLYNGFETLTRMVVILTFLVIVFSLIVLLLASMNYDTTLLFPLFPKGIKPFFYDILWTIGHPFGETVIIFSLLPRVNPDDKPHLGKLMYATLIMDGIFLSLLITCTIMTFGPLASDINYSLYAISQTIRIADFFDRIESVVGIVLIIICTVRAIIVLYILNLSICKSFRLKNERILILPLIIASFLHALSMVKQHRDLLDYYVSWFPFVGLVILAVPFLLITLIVFIRSKKNNLKPPKSTG